MKFKLLLGLCLFLLAKESHAQQAPLQASATKTWTIKTAREEVFKGVNGYIDTWGFPAKDPDYKIHKANIKKTSYVVGDTLVTNFSNGEYSTLKRCSTEAFYYDSMGALEAIDLEQHSSFGDSRCPSARFPTRAIRYNFPDGKIISALFSAFEYEDYLYEPNGSLIAHWIKNKGFDSNGHFFGTRVSHIERTTTQSR